MAITVPDNFSYGGKKPNFDRDQFETLEAMTSYPKDFLDEGHISYCVETKKVYIWNGLAWEVLTSTEIVPITYSELKNLRDKSQLVAGTTYRLTDYEFTTVQENTKSAGHGFDIILQALSSSELSEQGFALPREGDSYFNGSSLSAWQIWYTLDNDSNTYAWADEENGKGVIYRMIDEYQNDCPYDFKNAMYEHTDYCYTFGIRVQNSIGKFELFDMSTFYGKKCFNNKMLRFEDDGLIKLNYIICDLYCVEYSDRDFEIYDNTFGLNCHNDFFNGDIKNNTFGINFSNNTVGEIIGNVFIENSTNNRIGNNFENNTIGMHFNNNNIDLYFSNNTIGVGFSENIIGDYFRNNQIIDWFEKNKVGRHASENKFESGVSDCTIGDYFMYNTIGGFCLKNTFGNNCKHNTLGYECNDNNLGNNCLGNTLGRECSNNTFEDKCESNRLYTRCIHNTLSYGCKSNVFEDECVFNKLGELCKNNYFGMSCTFLIFAERTDGRKVNYGETDITFNTDYYDDKSGKIVPIKHPNLSTQPSILPYKFAGEYVYEQMWYVRGKDIIGDIAEIVSNTISDNVLLLESAVSEITSSGSKITNRCETYAEGTKIYTKGLSKDKHYWVRVVWTTNPIELKDKYDYGYEY